MQAWLNRAEERCLWMKMVSSSKKKKDLGISSKKKPPGKCIRGLSSQKIVVVGRRFQGWVRIIRWFVLMEFDFRHAQKLVDSSSSDDQLEAVNPLSKRARDTHDAVSSRWNQRVSVTVSSSFSTTHVRKGKGITQSHPQHSHKSGSSVPSSS